MKTEVTYMNIAAQYTCDGDASGQVHELLIARFEIVRFTNTQGEEINRMMWCLN
jgi:hypothetical protein